MPWPSTCPNCDAPISDCSAFEPIYTWQDENGKPLATPACPELSTSLKRICIDFAKLVPCGCRVDRVTRNYLQNTGPLPGEPERQAHLQMLEKSLAELHAIHDGQILGSPERSAVHFWRIVCADQIQRTCPVVWAPQPPATPGNLITIWDVLKKVSGERVRQLAARTPFSESRPESQPGTVRPSSGQTLAQIEATMEAIRSGATDCGAILRGLYGNEGALSETIVSAPLFRDAGRPKIDSPPLPEVPLPAKHARRRRTVRYGEI